MPRRFTIEVFNDVEQKERSAITKLIVDEVHSTSPPPSVAAGFGAFRHCNAEGLCSFDSDAVVRPDRANATLLLPELRRIPDRSVCHRELRLLSR